MNIWTMPEKPMSCALRAPAHRIDGVHCADCWKWVCAWHSWCGDDGNQYCPKCAPKHREDGMPVEAEAA